MVNVPLLRALNEREQDKTHPTLKSEIERNKHQELMCLSWIALFYFVLFSSKLIGSFSALTQPKNTSVFNTIVK